MLLKERERVLQGSRAEGFYGIRDWDEEAGVGISYPVGR